MAVLDVGDNGPGMEKEQLDQIFERFYRGDTSRTRRSGGAGLGLSITESIVHAHQGAHWSEKRAWQRSILRCVCP